jgi:RNA polymerase sigma-70 factor (ECF subfamily)
MDDCMLAKLFGKYRDRHDAGALAKVFDCLAPGLLKVARHLTRDRTLAEDLLQTTFLTAMEKASTFDDERPLRPWLAGILLRHARHQMRKSARTPDAYRLEPRKERDPGRLVEERELEAEVEKALLTLPEKYRQILVQRLKDGIPSKEIARNMGRSPGVVRMQIHRGLDLLKKALPQSLLTALFGFRWSRRALASVRGKVLANAGALSPATLSPMVMVGGLVVFNKMLLITTGAAILIGASVLVFWISDTENEGARPLRGEAFTVAGPVNDPALPQDFVQPSARDIEPVPPRNGAAEASILREPDTVKGRVLDYRGEPVSGVRVLTGREEDELIESDDSGRFELPGEYEEANLDVASPHVLVRSGRELEGEGLLLVVAPRTDLHGVVVDENNQPLEGTQVVVRAVRLVDFPEILDRTTRPVHFQPVFTDEQGRFELEQLPGGCAALRMEKHGYRIQSYPIGPESFGNQRFTLHTLASEVIALTGWVEDHTQRMVPDVLVGFGRLDTRTDDWGAFRIEYHKEDIPEHGARLYAAKPGYRTKMIPGFGTRPGDLAQQIEIVLRLDGPAMQISGHLFDTGGTPLQGFLILPWGEEYLAGLRTAEDLAVADGHAGPNDVPPWTVPPGARAYSITDRRGSFLLGGLDDRAYRLRVFNADAGIAMTTTPILAGSRNVEIRIPVDAFREVKGIVVDHRSEPVSGVLVRTSMRRWENSQDNFWDDNMKAVRTGEDGHFEFSKVCRLDTLMLYVDGDDICNFSTRIAPEGRSTGLILVVERRCYFRVELSDPSLAQSFHVLDENGERLEITEHTGEGGTRGFRDTPFPFREGKTEVVSVSDRACTLQLLGEEEILVSVRLTPKEITEVRY